MTTEFMFFFYERDIVIFWIYKKVPTFWPYAVVDGCRKLKSIFSCGGNRTGTFYSAGYSESYGGPQGFNWSRTKSGKKYFSIIKGYTGFKKLLKYLFF